MQHADYTGAVKVPRRWPTLLICASLCGCESDPPPKQPSIDAPTSAADQETLASPDWEAWIRNLSHAETEVRREHLVRILERGLESVSPLDSVSDRKGPDSGAATAVLELLEPGFTRSGVILDGVGFSISPDGGRIAYITESEAVVIWDTAIAAALSRTEPSEWEGIVEIPKHDWGAQRVLARRPTYSRDGTRVFVGAESGRLLSVQGSTGEPGALVRMRLDLTDWPYGGLLWLRTLHNGALISTDGCCIWLVTDLCTLALTGFITSRPLTSPSAAETRGNRVAILAGWGEEFRICTYDTGNWKLMNDPFRAKTPANLIAAASLIPALHLARRGEFWLERRDTAPPTLRHHRVVQASPITEIAASSNGAWIATGGEDGVVRLFLSTTLERLATVVVGSAPEQIEFSADDSLMAVLAGGKIHLFRRR